MFSVQEVFSTPPEFCVLCGSILPVLTASKSDKCMVCDEPIKIKPRGATAGAPDEEEEDDDIVETKSYVITFNERNVYSSRRKLTGDVPGKKKKPTEEGPRVNRQCPKCDSTKMTYATVQLRSADEGQTVFYTCPKCGFKDNENS